MYVLSYQGPSFRGVAVVKVNTGKEAQNYIANLPDDFCGIVIDSGPDSASLRRANGQLLIKLHNILADDPVDRFANALDARTALFNYVKKMAVEPAPEMLLEKEQEEVHEASASETSTESPGEETSQPEETASAETAGDEPKEATMAKAKSKSKAKKAPKAAKAAKAPKAANGQPREGSKKAELLRLLQRKTGATMKEMLDATGWKACLGTAKAVTVAAKLKFRHEKGEGDKPSRWYAE